ncbi:MAG: hypothetical protein Fur0043_16330 [Anaerolineales bacterium]
MKTINCPMCGKPNPDDLVTCQFCDARLRPLTDELSRSQPPIRPGEEPTPKSTGELEPVLPSWLREIRQQARETAEEEKEQVEAQEETAAPAESVDWLAGLEAQSEDEEEIPDWLINLRGDKAPTADEQPFAPPPTPTAEESGAEHLPGWIADLGAAASPSEPGAQDELSAWLADKSKEENAPSAESPAASSPDLGWRAGLETDFQPEAEPPASADLGVDLPDWLASSEAKTGEAPEIPALPAFTEAPSQPADEGLPDWLASIGQETGEAPEIPAPPAFTEAPSQPADEGLPDWLASMEQTIPESREAQGVESSETADWMTALGQNELPSQGEETAATPAFVDDEGAPISSGDVDAIFSMEMPEWLSEISSDKQEDTTEDTGEGSLSPAELPSWVKAMRPVEAVLSEGETAAAEQPIEEKGPLAGLRGVLPLSQVAPTSKPKPYSLKLQASEEQQNNASLLEQLLVGESYPRPMTTAPTVFSQRLLRQLLALLILVVVGTPIFLNTRLNPVPFSVPNETNAAKQFIESTLPPDAPVLIVFDYEAALVGELEASAAPLIDYMVLLKHPRLGLLSITPIGTGLSEHFMKLENTQVSTYYQAGQSYVNLGFLPGGAAGILAFAENPPETKPLDLNGQNAWETPVLQGVQQLSQFAAVILLTDDADSARLWIEQTQNKMGPGSLLVISSAQAGPMLQPYVQSGQIDGLVVGLGSSAPIEQINSGRPGLARRYWDAYGMGLLTAVLAISVGSLWNLAIHWRSRQSERGV